MNVAAIYSITNVLTGDRYVGSSANVYTRRNDHFSALRRNKSRHPGLQESWNMHGESAFEFKILEKVKDPEKLRKREQLWINKLKPTLNLSRNANGSGDAKREYMRRKCVETGESSQAYHRFILTAPDGRQMCTDNLTQFAIHFKLDRSSLQAVASGRYRSHKGWRCQRLDRNDLSISPIKKRTRAKRFLLTSPNGTEMLVEKLTEFCNSVGIQRHSLYQVMHGRLKVSVDGWKCKAID